MTPPENPDGKPDPSAEKTSVITTPGGSADSRGSTPAAVDGGAPPEPAASGGAAAEEQPAAAPPPWQRVTSDVQYVAEHEQPAAAPAAPAAAQPEHQAAPHHAAPPQPGGYPAGDQATARVFPVVSGTATPPGLAGIPGVDGGRTSVNLGAPASRAATPAAAPSARRPGRGPRRASLQVKRIDPWSVLKLALVLSVALFFVWLVAVGVLYGVLNGMGVWDQLNGTYNELVQGGGDTSGPLISAGRVFGVAAIIGAINIVLFTALATVGAFVYNVSADLAGGLEITLSERE